jgi:MFS transporter, PPP family, 3-phenylpropionic acid transporter
MSRLQVRDAVAVQGLFLLFGLPIAAFFPFFAIYLQDHHGLSGSQIGLVLAAAAAIRMVANPLWGHFADTSLGRLRALQVGLVGAAIAAIALNEVIGLAWVVAAAVAHSAFMVAHGPNIDAIALTHLGEDRMSEYGRIRGWESLTYAAGCLLFGVAMQAFGLGWAMPIYAGSVLLVLAWTSTFVRDRPHQVDDHGRLGAVGAAFRAAPRFWGFLAAVLLVWIGFNAAWNFISLKIADSGGGPLLIGIGTALGGLIELPTMRSSSRLHARLGLRKVYVIGCLIYATGFLLWGAVTDPRILSALTLLEGIAFSLLFTTAVVVVGRLLPSSLYSTGNAITATVGFGIGPIVGAGIGGFVYQHLGAFVLYSAASFAALAAAVVAWFALAVPALDRPLRDDEEPGPLAMHHDAGPLV